MREPSNFEVQGGEGPDQDIEVLRRPDAEDPDFVTDDLTFLVHEDKDKGVSIGQDVLGWGHYGPIPR